MLHKYFVQGQEKGLPGKCNICTCNTNDVKIAQQTWKQL